MKIKRRTSFKYSFQKGFSFLVLLGVIGLIVVLVVGITIKNKNGVSPTTTGTTVGNKTGSLVELASRNPNEFFPQSVDNLSALSIFGKDETGGPEYKVIRLDQTEISSKEIGVKVAVREAYQALYGNLGSASGPNELYFFKLTTDEDVNNMRQLIDYSFKNLPTGYIQERTNTTDKGVEVWLAKVSDKSVPDEARILLPELRIYIRMRLFASKGQAALLAKNYVDFIKSHSIGSYIDSQYLLADKYEVEKLSKTRKEFIQKALQ
jgi:hypothetical protein